MTTSNVEMLCEVLQQISDKSLALIYNAYAEENSYEERIYMMGEFNYLCENMTPLQIVSSIDKDFDSDADYFYIDNHGDYCSTSDVSCFIEDMSSFEDLANFVSEHWYSVKKILTDVNDRNVFDEMSVEMFTEFAEDTLPKEWLEDNIDYEQCITDDWDYYLEELRTEYEEDEN